MASPSPSKKKQKTNKTYRPRGTIARGTITAHVIHTDWTFSAVMQCSRMMSPSAQKNATLSLAEETPRLRHSQLEPFSKQAIFFTSEARPLCLPRPCFTRNNQMRFVLFTSPCKITDEQEMQDIFFIIVSD